MQQIYRVCKTTHIHSARKMVSMTETRTILAYTLPLRLFLAYEWLNGGLEKIEEMVADPAAAQGFAAVFGRWAKGNPYPFMADFLNGFAIPNAAAVFTFVAVAEFLVGIALLLGFLVRPASVGGIIMNVFFYLAAGFSSASTSGVNLVMIGAQLSMILLAPGRVLGIDALFHKRFPRIPLW